MYYFCFKNALNSLHFFWTLAETFKKSLDTIVSWTANGIWTIFLFFKYIFIFIIILLASNTLTNSIVFISLLKKARKGFRTIHQATERMSVQYSPRYSNAPCSENLLNTDMLNNTGEPYTHTRVGLVFFQLGYLRAGQGRGLVG